MENLPYKEWKAENQAKIGMRLGEVKRTGLEHEVMLKLQDKFKCKTLGDVNYYLGLHIERDVEKRWMRVHQKKNLEALAANSGKSVKRVRMESNPGGSFSPPSLMHLGHQNQRT
ncbi:hypothetical protein CLOM_g1507 [Closterium sp. NIES-68]|nr:hypothetical protein CLOM_g1507 [Closterium sp. NIES-68]